MHQVENGTHESAEQLMEKLEQGALSPPIEACIDARSVFDAIAASDITTPQEASLKLHLVSIRNRLEKGTLKRLWCVDTRDMVADALTKGGIDRKLITMVMNDSKLILQHPFVKYESKVIGKENSNSKYSPLELASTTMPERRGRPRIYPREAVFDCKACKKSLPMTHASHSRNDGPPELCRYPHVVPIVFSCPGCVRDLSGDHPDHTHIEGECREPATRTTGVRRRRGPHRDPAVVASGISEDRNRLNVDTDFDSDVIIPPPIPPPIENTGERDVEELLRHVGRGPYGADGVIDPYVADSVTPAGGENGAEATLPPINEEEVDEQDVVGELAPASAREQAIAKKERIKRLTSTTSGQQSDNMGVEDWRSFDVSKAMAALHSGDASTRK